MPKSRVRSKAVYTPPPRTAKSKVSPRWLVPTMLGCLLVGLAWIALYYITGGTLPIQALSGVEPRHRVRPDHRGRRAVHEVAVASPRNGTGPAR